jgi:hypothetical protein
LPILAGLSLWLADSWDGWDGSGRRTVVLDFCAVDAGTGRPVPGALIRLYEGTPEHSLTTGPDGHARFLYRDAAVAMSYGGLRGHRTRVHYGWMVSASADGYERKVADLSTLTGDPRYHSEALPPPILVRLERRRQSP